jgi:hypothetical protein
VNLLPIKCEILDVLQPNGPPWSVTGISFTALAQDRECYLSPYTFAYEFFRSSISSLRFQGSWTEEQDSKQAGQVVEIRLQLMEADGRTGLHYTKLRP